MTRGSNGAIEAADTFFFTGVTVTKYLEELWACWIWTMSV